MNWQDLDGFVAMGGYGLYVWGALGMSAAAIAIELLLVGRRWRRARARALRRGAKEGA